MLRNVEKHPVKGLGWGAGVTLVRARVGSFSTTRKYYYLGAGNKKAPLRGCDEIRKIWASRIAA
jgi:hypothetical protein